MCFRTKLNRSWNKHIKLLKYQLKLHLSVWLSACSENRSKPGCFDVVHNLFIFNTGPKHSQMSWIRWSCCYSKIHSHRWYSSHPVADAAVEHEHFVQWSRETPPCRGALSVRCLFRTVIITAPIFRGRLPRQSLRFPPAEDCKEGYQILWYARCSHFWPRLCRRNGNLQGKFLTKLWCSYYLCARAPSSNPCRTLIESKTIATYLPSFCVKLANSHSWLKPLYHITCIRPLCHGFNCWFFTDIPIVQQIACISLNAHSTDTAQMFAGTSHCRVPYSLPKAVWSISWPC
jgi:hypothetical protein